MTRPENVYHRELDKSGDEDAATFLADIAAGRLHPIRCAWCEEGADPVGWSEVEHSDGICDKHKAELLSGIEGAQ